MFETIKEDLARYRQDGRTTFHEPSIVVILVYRLGQFIGRCNVPVLKQFLKLIHWPFFVTFSLLTGIHLPRGCKIGPGLRIYHFGCVIINPETVIGARCTLRHGVTIGNRKSDHDVPVLGDDVDIGAGAKILGDIKIGDRVAVGANAVVLCDVPDDHLAVGVPAVIKPKKKSRA